MKGALRIVALGIVSWLMPACFLTYTGIYFLSRPHEVSRAQAERIARDLGVALAAFGFSEVHQPEGNPLVVFSSERRPVPPELASLAGSDARISVAVDLDSPSITIRDMSNAEETEFVKALKGSIERQKDFLFY